MELLCMPIDDELFASVAQARESSRTSMNDVAPPPTDAAAAAAEALYARLQAEEISNAEYVKLAREAGVPAAIVAAIVRDRVMALPAAASGSVKAAFSDVTLSGTTCRLMTGSVSFSW